MHDPFLYPDFTSYIRQGEPSQRRRAENWAIAIGLQAVDGLRTSEYLHQVAKRNIEGEVEMGEVPHCAAIIRYRLSVRANTNKRKLTRRRPISPICSHSPRSISQFTGI